MSLLEVELTGEVDIECGDCGGEIEASQSLNGVVTVVPCPYCIGLAFAEGKEEGKSEIETPREG